MVREEMVREGDSEGEMVRGDGEGGRQCGREMVQGRW